MRRLQVRIGREGHGAVSLHYTQHIKDDEVQLSFSHKKWRTTR